MSDPATDKTIKPAFHLHATSVAFGEKGIVITGRSGSGKSSLALQLIGLGAVLISDDLTRLSILGGAVFAHAPVNLAGVIEARGIGLIRVPFQQRTLVHLVVDLDRNEQERLPHRHETNLLGTMIETIYKADGPHFPVALRALVLEGRHNEG